MDERTWYQQCDGCTKLNEHWIPINKEQPLLGLCEDCAESTCDGCHRSMMTVSIDLWRRVPFPAYPAHFLCPVCYIIYPEYSGYQFRERLTKRMA